MSRLGRIVGPGRIIIGGAGPAPYVGPEESIDFDGAAEVMRFDQLVGGDAFAGSDVWTIQMWTWPDIIAANDYLFMATEGGSTTKNRIRWYSQSPSSSSIGISNTAGTEFKRYTLASPFPFDNLWNDAVFTWDGTNLKVYLNGHEVVTNLTKSVDNAGTMGDLKELAISATTTPAAAAKQTWYSMACWSTVLTAAEVLAIHNTGNGNTFDLEADSGDYASSATLTNWWKPGEDEDDLGEDYVSGKATLDLMNNAANIDKTDLVALYPDGNDDWKRSLNMDGTAEKVMSLNSTDVGCDNEWTLACWFWSDILQGNDVIMNMCDGSATNQVIVQSTLGNTQLLVDLYNNGGLLRKRYEIAAGIEDNAWGLYAITWKGSTDTLVLTRNGVDLGATKTLDVACTQDANMDTICFGGKYTGNVGAKGYYHQAFVWSNALTTAELVALYNGGVGYKVDPTSDFGNYASSATLLHWWKLGFEIEDIGKDYSGSGSPIDLMDNQVGIATIDISTFAPDS